MEWYIVVWCSLLGLVVGSFLNVVIYRFHTGKSLQGRSRCLSCGHTLSWVCLFPVASYLALRGRCAYCTARISPRYFLVELLTALLFGMVAATTSSLFLTLALLTLVSLLVVILVYDLLHTIIPDEYVIAVTVVAVGIGALSIFDAQGAYVVREILLRLAGGAVGFLFFASLWYVSRGRWIGFGDAKLAFPLGLIVSWPGVVSMVVFSFWIGAVISVCLLGLQYLAWQGRLYLVSRPQSSLFFRLTVMLQTYFRLPRLGLTMKSEIPFAPFLICGFVLVYFFSLTIFTFITFIFFFMPATFV